MIALVFGTQECARSWTLIVKEKIDNLRHGIQFGGWYLKKPCLHRSWQSEEQEGAPSAF